MVENVKEKNVEIGGDTSDELLKLKKELANDVVEKLLEKDPDVVSFIMKEQMADYLVNENTISDVLNDKLLLGGVVLNIVGFDMSTLERYREMFSKVTTKNELEKLRTSIFNEIGGTEQVATSSKEVKFSTAKPSTITESSEPNGNDAALLNPQSSNLMGTNSLKENTDTEKKEEKSDKSNKKHKNKKEKSNAGKSDKSDKKSEDVTSNKKSEVSSGEIYEIDSFDIIVSPESKKIWDSLTGKEKPALEPFACALRAYNVLKSKGRLKNIKYLTVVDFTKNQIKDNRLFVINMETNTVEYAEKCGHGQGSGGKEWATKFGNKSGSNKSSLGALITADGSRSNRKGTRKGNFGVGQEKSNSNSRGRGIAVHPVRSEVYRSGKPTSQGCFTIEGSQAYVNEILRKIEGGSLIFSYAKSKDYFAQSDYFQQKSDGTVVA